MEATAMAIVAAVIVFTLIIWAMMLFMGKRQTWFMLLAVAALMITCLVLANAFGYIEIWSVLTPPPAVTTP